VATDRRDAVVGRERTAHPAVKDVIERSSRRSPSCGRSVGLLVVTRRFVANGRVSLTLEARTRSQPHGHMPGSSIADMCPQDRPLAAKGERRCLRKWSDKASGSMMANLRQRVTAINGLLALVYGEDTRLSVVLERLGASDAEIARVREHCLGDACNRVIEAVGNCFQGFRDGSRDFMTLSRRLGLDGEVRTLQEIGIELGVTKERARQIEERARMKCRSPRIRNEVEVTLRAVLAPAHLRDRHSD